MDITERKITKIAREVSKFTVRTLRAEGIGPGEFDVLYQRCKAESKAGFPNVAAAVKEGTTDGE